MTNQIIISKHNIRNMIKCNLLAAEITGDYFQIKIEPSHALFQFIEQRIINRSEIQLILIHLRLNKI